MYIEDILFLATNVKMNPWDSTLVYSFQDQLSKGSGLTEKQAALAVKILSKYINKINVSTGKDLTPYITTPVFKFNIRTLNIVKRISVIDHLIYNRSLKVEFSYNEQIINKIRAEKSKLNSANWDPELKAWVFSLDERSIIFLADLANEFGFSGDDEFSDFAAQARTIQSNLEDYIPNLSKSGDQYKFNNVSHRVPQPISNNPIDALFEARQAGINTWDETIEEQLNRAEVSSVVRDFLKTSPAEIFSLNTTEHSLLSVGDVVKSLLPCLIVIPGGSELDKLTTSVTFLNEIGINNSEMSVLFRLPKITGDDFNNFIRNNNINNPVTKDTKVVFISSKIPKTLLDPRKEFNCVINFNFYSIHYTIRDFLKWHHNVISVLEKKSNNETRSSNFGDM